jgi:hypothetical protein
MKLLAFLALLLTPALAHAVPGTAEVWHADRRDGTAHYETRVRLDNGARAHVAVGQAPDVRFQHGDRVQIVDGRLERLMQRAPAITGGVHRVGILVASYADMPHPMNGADTIARFLLDFFSANSYGALTMQVDVLGPYKIATKAGGCDYSTIAAQTRAAALAAKVPLWAYYHVVYAFPDSPACPWLGYSTVGGNPSTTYVHGALAYTIYAHELGHALGLYHSHSTANGITYEYGDTMDTMGSGWGQHFNAAQKGRLGWVTPRVVPDGTYRLTPLETTPDALRAGDVWVALRASVGSSGVPGVLVHLDGGPAAITLPDTTPTTSAITDPALPAGAVWAAPSGLKVKVESVTASAATVSMALVIPPPVVVPPVLADVTATCTRVTAQAERCEAVAGPYTCARTTGGVWRVSITSPAGRASVPMPNPKRDVPYQLRCTDTGAGAMLRVDGVTWLEVAR